VEWVLRINQAEESFDIMYTVWAVCTFYGTVVLATGGVRATVCTIESFYLCASSASSKNSTTLLQYASPNAMSNLLSNIAHALSARYDVPVTIIDDIRKLPRLDPITRYSKSSLIARIYETTTDSFVSLQKRKILPRESRIHRTLDFMVRHDGKATTSEIQALHCSEGVVCIHGKTGLSATIDTLTRSYDRHPAKIKRFERGSYKITRSGIADLKRRKKDIACGYTITKIRHFGKPSQKRVVPVVSKERS